jgi:hypothetical protein
VVVDDGLPDVQVDGLLRRMFDDRPMGQPFVRPIVRAQGLEQLAEIRREVVGWAAQSVFEVELAADELAMNALLHGSEPIQLVVAADRDVAVVAVADGSGQLPSLADEPHHGLGILDNLTRGRLYVIPISGAGKWVVAVVPTPSGLS